MKKFVEKLIGRLYENVKSNSCPSDSCWEHSNKYCDKCNLKKIMISDVIEIVNQLAEEYNNDVCEWKYHRTIDDIPMYETSCYHEFEKRFVKKYKFCPYCGKKIKVVE